ncbi:MAG: 2-amino-4-hydroxy-6-hydroxymethyldihydropteridine diphosphokinase [Deltaproteobacteria bacterium]|nr:2-amino-4-hydroxy-6-hydroxymethyldihydropteridine diphosphokinase [Deltaproteobacteria bacterium]
MAQRVYVGLGSNLGDRKANLREAEERLAELPDTRIVKASSLYESEPHGNAKTWFINSVLEIETELAPEAFLKQALAIEKAMGRKRVAGKRWGSRIIDIDLLLIDNQTVNKKNLKIPHPEMHKRRFVLMPLAELAPHVTHPHVGASMSELLGGLKDPKKVMLTRP